MFKEIIFVLLFKKAFRILALIIVASNLGFVPINKIKSVIELILKRINQSDSAFNSEEENLLLALENCIEHYVEFNQSFDAGGNPSESTNTIGVEMFKSYSKHSLNPIKINRCWSY